MNRRQQKFIDQYLIHFNAARAAREAGYSERSARQLGSRLLTNVDIQAEIQERTEMKPVEVRARLADIARGSITDLGGLLPADIREELEGNPSAKLIKKVTRRTSRSKSAQGTETENETFEIELYSAHDALRDIGKMHAMFTEKTELTGADGGPIKLDADLDKALRKIYGDGNS